MGQSQRDFELLIQSRLLTAIFFCDIEIGLYLNFRLFYMVEQI